MRRSIRIGTVHCLINRKQGFECRALAFESCLEFNEVARTLTLEFKFKKLGYEVDIENFIESYPSNVSTISLDKGSLIWDILNFSRYKEYNRILVRPIYKERGKEMVLDECEIEPVFDKSSSFLFKLI